MMSQAKGLLQSSRKDKMKAWSRVGVGEMRAGQLRQLSS